MVAEIPRAPLLRAGLKIRIIVTPQSSPDCRVARRKSGLWSPEAKKDALGACGFCLLDGVRRTCASQLISPTPIQVTTCAQHHGPAVCKRVPADRAWEAPAEAIVDVVAQSCLLSVVVCCGGGWKLKGW